MECPKCVGILEEKTVEDIKIDVCWACEGIWFDEGELGKILERDSENFCTVDLGRDELDGKELSDVKDFLNEKSAKCPRCQKKMEKKPYEKNKSVLTDACPGGCGVWLDGTEVEQLRNRRAVESYDRKKVAKLNIKIAFESLALKLFGENKKKKNK